MKKILVIMVSLAVLGLLLAGCSEIANITAPGVTESEGVATLSREVTYDPDFSGEFEEYILFAGQDIEVGTVKVWNNEENLYVEYMVDEPWCLMETHVHVGATKADFPLTPGGPAPGLFDYSKDHDCVGSYTYYTIPLDDWDNVLIAAHAVVRNTEEYENETLYLTDSGPEGTDLFSVELNNGNADLTFLTKLLTPYFDQVDAIACTPDGSTVYAIDRYSRKLGAYDVSSGIFTDLGLITDYPGYVVSAAFSPDGTLYVYSNDTTGLYSIDTNTKTATSIKDMSLRGITDIVFDSDGTLFLYGQDPGLYKMSSISESATFIEDLQLYLTGLAIRGAGSGALVGSDKENNTIYEIDKSNGSIIKKYPMHLEGLPYEYTFGDMTVGELGEPVYLEETAWADGTRFVDRGNWATYFEYDVKSWVVFDTFDVPATTSSPTSSNKVLAEDAPYKIEAVGTYFFRNEGDSGGYLADAEYADRNDSYGTGWTAGDGSPYSGPYNGLDLCDASNLFLNIDWGELDKDDHTYSIYYTGENSVLRMFIKDNAYGDNSGGLTVNIYEWK